MPVVFAVLAEEATNAVLDKRHDILQFYYWIHFTENDTRNFLLKLRYVITNILLNTAWSN